MNEDDHWARTETVVPHWANRSKRRPGIIWTPADRATLTGLWLQKPKLTAEQIGEIMGREKSTIYAKVHQMGLPSRQKSHRNPTMRDKAEFFDSGRRVHRADPTGQRRKTPLGESNGPKITLQPHDPRARAGSTVFPATVIPAAKLTRLLKSGHNSYKIGAILTKGKWKGMPIFTLTREERATCPRSCAEWLTCYGNNMPFPHRIYDGGTMQRRLWGELAALSADNPSGFIVRLHVLGDFDSVGYVEFWRQALTDFPALHIFGFTARRPDDPIGAALLLLTAQEYERFRMRFSGGGHKTDCAEVVDKPEDVNFVRCPAETSPDRCCATCGLCMQSNVSISFVRH